MICNLKRLGLMLAAMGVLGAMAASAAQATPEFTAFNPSTYEHPSEASLHATQMESLEGSATHDFTAGGGTVKCSTATFTGTLTAPASSTLTAAPTYSECKASFGETTHVAMNGCEYLFHLETEPTEGEYTGTIDLLCPESEGPTLTVTTSGGGNKCVLHIEPDQEGLGTVDFREAGGEMEAEATVTGLAYTATGGFFNCGVTEGTHTDGTYEGNVTATAKEGETTVVLQATPSQLVSSPGVLKIEKDVKNEGTITLTTSGKNKMEIEKTSTSTAYKDKKNNCTKKEVPCTIVIECLEKGVFAPYVSVGFDLKTELYHTAVTKVECV